MGKWNGPPENQRRHILTREDQAKKGEAWRLNKSLERKLYCDIRCRIYPCFWQPLTKRPDNLVEIRDKEGRVTSKRYKCALKSMPENMHRHIECLMQPTESNLDRAITEIVTVVAAMTAQNPSLRLWKEYLDCLIKFKDTIHGKKVKSEISGGLEGTIRVVWDDSDTKG